MKTGMAQAVVAGVAILLAAAAAIRGQTNSSATDPGFSLVAYYPTPYQRQMKSRLSGTKVLPQAANWSVMAIQQFKLETFAEDGKTLFMITGPDCVYDTVNGVASSPGHLQLQSGDGNIFTEGDGFLWQQADSCLMISNSVWTEIKGTPILPGAAGATGKHD
jgi:hypothetical protein